MKYVLFVFVLVVAYLIGSIPTGFLVSAAYGIKDIRNHGSGNIGATNVGRMLGWKFFCIILCVDACKAASTLFIIRNLGVPVWLTLASAFVLLCGNVYSMFLGGSGGKGVATMVGIITALFPQLVIPLLCIMIISLIITQTMGLSSVITACAVIPFAVRYNMPLAELVLLCFCVIVVILRHIPNVRHFIG